MHNGLIWSSYDSSTRHAEARHHSNIAVSSQLCASSCCLAAAASRTLHLQRSRTQSRCMCSAVGSRQQQHGHVWRCCRTAGKDAQSVGLGRDCTQIRIYECFSDSISGDAWVVAWSAAACRCWMIGFVTHAAAGRDLNAGGVTAGPTVAWPCVFLLSWRFGIDFGRLKRLQRCNQSTPTSSLHDSR